MQGKVVLRMIVSTPQELPFVLMNLIELKDLFDTFLITEANITHDGQKKDFEFENVYQEFIEGKFANVHYLRMDLLDKVRVGEVLNDDNRLYNVYLIRNEFCQIYSLSDSDIVIGLEGDEVLYNSFAIKCIIQIVKFATVFKIPLAFTLTLHQFACYLNLFQRGIDYYGPSVGNLLFFRKKPNPHFKYEGRRVRRPFGCHFSWIMSDEQIIEKRDRYAHRSDSGPNWILESSESIRIKVAEMRHDNRDLLRENILINSCNHKVYPLSLKFVRGHLSDNLILLAPWFWEHS